MILNKQFLENIDTSAWGLKSDNSVANNKIKFKTVFEEIVKDLENKFTADVIEQLISYITDADKNDIDCALAIMNESLALRSAKDIFYALQILEIIITCHPITEDQVASLMALVTKIDEKFKVYTGDYNEAINTQLRKVGTYVYEAKSYFENNQDDIDMPSDVKYWTCMDRAKMSQKHDETVTEGTVNVWTENREWYRYTKDLEIDKFVEYLHKIETSGKDSPEIEYVCQNFRNIPKYVEYIFAGASHDKEYLESPIYMLAHCHWLARHSYIALSELDDISGQIVDALDHMIFNTYEEQEAADKIKMYIEHELSERIDTSFSNAETEIPNPIIEMGFGYIYEYLPEDCDNLTEAEALDICNKLSDYAQKNNVLSMLQESCELLNEGFAKDAYNDARQRKLDRYEMKKQKERDDYEFKKQKRQDDYDRKKQKADRDAENDSDNRRRKSDLKKDYNYNVKSDEYDTKRAMKQDERDFERQGAANKRDEKRMNKEATKMALAERIRSLPLTSNAMWKVYEALHRAVGAAAMAGGAAVIGVNPIIGACLYLIPKYFATKGGGPTAKGKERSRAIAKINAEIDRLDVKIDEAERRNNYKAKTELSGLKTKLEHTRARIASEAGARGSAVIV